MQKKVTSLIVLFSLLMNTQQVLAINENNINNDSKIETEKQLSIITQPIKSNIISQIKNSIKEQQQKQIKIIENNKEKERKDNVRVYQKDITIVSNITEEELNKVFEIKKQPQMKQFTTAFIECEKQYNINAFTMASIVAQESLWGKKPGGNGTNYTGYCIHNGIEREGSQFNNGQRNIIETARLIAEDYIPNNSKYNCGGPSIYDVNSKYCLKPDGKTIDYSWADNITQISNDLEYIYHYKVKDI